MATANGGTVTITRGATSVQADGTTTVNLNYSNAAGVLVHSRMLIIPGDGSQVRDQFGTVIVTPAPVALMNAIAAFTGQLDTSIANGAAAGKLSL